MCRGLPALPDAGKPGYVDHRWATLEEAVGWINGAGGVAVVAHPGRYKMSGAQMRISSTISRMLAGGASRLPAAAIRPTMSCISPAGAAL
jgi:predicted metal-dependent phosphoesterase TrpH